MEFVQGNLFILEFLDKGPGQPSSIVIYKAEGNLARAGSTAEMHVTEQPHHEKRK